MKIFKLDADITEDIIDITSEIDNLINLYDSMYSCIRKNDGIPPEFIDYGYDKKSLTLLELSFYEDDISIQIFLPYLIINDSKKQETHIIELDKGTNSIYAYNLKERNIESTILTDDISRRIINIYNYAKSLGLQETYTGNIPFNKMMLVLISGLEGFTTLTQLEMDVILSWLGYDTIKNSYN